MFLNCYSEKDLQIVSKKSKNGGGYKHKFQKTLKICSHGRFLGIWKYDFTLLIL